MKTPDSADTRLRIRIDDDRLAAWLGVDAGPPLPREAIGEMLDQAGIVAGRDEVTLTLAATALATPEAAAQAFCVARGWPAVDATPDVLELTAPIGPVAGLLGPDERFDFRERQLIVPVQAGETLGRIVPGQAGKPGLDVFGEVLTPRAAAELRLDLGPGVVREPDGRLVAVRSGARTVSTAGALDVVELYVHKGSVDLKSGHLETEGSLQVGGDVVNGMIVRAGVDAEVRGTVEAARLEAGGSIEIRGGVIGVGRGCVRAMQDLKIRHANGARLFAGGTLEVGKSVLNSELHAREITIGGTLQGDKAFAESSIRVRDVGSPAGTSCLLRAAHPAESSTSGIAEGENAARERARSRLGGATPALSARKGRETRKGRGDRPATAKAAGLEPRIALRKRQRALQPLARIEVLGTAHAGCRIDFGGRPLVLESAVKARRFRFDVERDEVIAEEL